MLSRTEILGSIFKLFVIMPCTIKAFFSLFFVPLNSFRENGGLYHFIGHITDNNAVTTINIFIRNRTIYFIQ